MMNASEELILKYIQLKEKYSKTIVIIPKSDVGATDFHIDMIKKTELVDIGRQAVRTAMLQ